MIRKEFLLYLIVGGLSFALDFSILYATTQLLSLHYLTGATLGFISGLILNYHLSTKFVFKSKKLENKYSEFIIFSTIGVIGLILNNTTILLLTETFKIHYLASKIAATSLTLIFNFSARKITLFTVQKTS